MTRVPVVEPVGAMLRADMAAQFPGRRFTASRVLILAVLEPGWNATVLLRLQLWLHGHGRRQLARLVRARNIRRNGLDARPEVRLGGGVIIRHPVGIVLGPYIIGERCWIGARVVVGRRRPEGPRAQARIGDDVVLGTGCAILAASLGDRSVVGANAVVRHDVAPDQTVYGCPARTRA